MDIYGATRQLIELALNEDIGSGDLTALAVPPDVRATARIIAKENCVLSGLELASLVLEVFGADAKVTTAPGCVDGAAVQSGQAILEFGGRARDLLTTERTILNLSALAAWPPRPVDSAKRSGAKPSACSIREKRCRAFAIGTKRPCVMAVSTITASASMKPCS